MYTYTLNTDKTSATVFGLLSLCVELILVRVFYLASPLSRSLSISFLQFSFVLFSFSLFMTAWNTKWNLRENERTEKEKAKEEQLKVTLELEQLEKLKKETLDKLRNVDKGLTEIKELVGGATEKSNKSKKKPQRRRSSSSSSSSSSDSDRGRSKKRKGGEKKNKGKRSRT